MIDLGSVGFIHVDHDRYHDFALRIDRQAGTGSLLAAGMGGDVLTLELSESPAHTVTRIIAIAEFL